jgi:adhesin HecA-like repeat protein
MNSAAMTGVANSTFENLDGGALGRGVVSKDDPGAGTSFVIPFVTYGDLKLNGRTVKFEKGVTQYAPGKTALSGGTLELGAGTSFQMNGGHLDKSGGTISGGQGLLISLGTIEVDTGKVLVVIGGFTQSGGTVSLTTGGTINVSGTYSMSGGTVTVPGAGTLLAANSFSQTAGTLTIINGGKLDSNTTISVGGMLVLSTGGLVHSAGSVSILAGGTLNGIGSITIDSGAVLNSGTINVGGVGAVGVLHITGNYTQAGTLNVEIASSSYDRLEVTGLATLAGTLNVTFLGGFTAFPGLLFSVLTYGSRSGMFTTLNLPTLGFGRWDPRYDDLSGTFTLWVIY